MREIEFRAKSKRNGEWIYGGIWTAIHHNDNDREVAIVLNGLSRELVDPNTIGQYTELEDKNGTKIFEGDIIKARHNANVYIVKFEECRFKIEDCWGNMIKMTQEAINHFECEVIGNIYDNPELIKE